MVRLGPKEPRLFLFFLPLSSLFLNCPLSWAFASHCVYISLRTLTTYERQNTTAEHHIIFDRAFPYIFFLLFFFVFIACLWLHIFWFTCLLSFLSCLVSIANGVTTLVHFISFSNYFGRSITVETYRRFKIQNTYENHKAGSIEREVRRDIAK